MAERFGQAFWPGVRGFISCNYTASHGITPGIATLTIPEQDPGKIPSYGDLIITDGNGKIRLRDCKMTGWTFSGGAGTPRTITMHIADRRWMWAFGVAWGDWNQIDPHPDPATIPEGEFIASGGPWMPGTYRPAYKMMADLLALMNEHHPLIEPVPDIPVPMRWNGMRPAQALAALCDELNYVIAYQPIADRILLTPKGVGASLPNLIPIHSSSVSASLPTLPSRLELHGGETIFNDYIRLEPCGPERNGEIRTLDDLSYRPANGWGASGLPPWFGSVPAGDNMTKEETVKLAQANVWRMYRPSLAAVDNPNGVMDVPGFGPVTDRNQIVLGSQLYGLSKDEQGQLRTEPAFAVGSVYYPPMPERKLPGALVAAGATGGNTSFGARLPVSFAVDATRGVILFDRYLFKLNAARQPVAPQLLINTGFRLRDSVGLRPARFIVGGPTGATAHPRCPPAIVHHAELVQVVNVVRSVAAENPTFALADVATNLDELLPLANYYLRAAMREYELDAAATIHYPGVVGIEPDGAIAQVTWQVGGSPAMTTASRNTEHTYYLPTAKERRVNEQAWAFETQLRIAEQKRNGPPQPGPSIGDTPEPPRE